MPVVRRSCRRRGPRRSRIHHTASQARDSSFDLVDFHTAGSATLALVDATNGKVQKTVERRDNPGSQATGAYDGSYAVWKETHIAGDIDDFVVKAWNAASGTIRTVGGSRRDSSGNVYPSPWEDPVIAGGRAAWIESTDSRGAGVIVTDGTWWAWIAGTTPTLYAGREDGDAFKVGVIPRGGGSPGLALARISPAAAHGMSCS